MQKGISPAGLKFPFRRQKSLYLLAKFVGHVMFRILQDLCVEQHWLLHLLSLVLVVVNQCSQVSFLLNFFHLQGSAFASWAQMEQANPQPSTA